MYVSWYNVISPSNSNTEQPSSPTGLLVPLCQWTTGPVSYVTAGLPVTGRFFIALFSGDFRAFPLLPSPEESTEAWLTPSQNNPFENTAFPEPKKRTEQILETAFGWRCRLLRPFVSSGFSGLKYSPRNQDERNVPHASVAWQYWIWTSRGCPGSQNKRIQSDGWSGCCTYNVRGRKSWLKNRYFTFVYIVHNKSTQFGW